MTEEEARLQFPEYIPKRTSAVFKDRTGERYGRLTVIYRTTPSSKNSKWVCRCDCGNYCAVNICGLIQNKTTSCGCYQKEQTSNAKKKFNHYILNDEYGVGYLSNTHHEFYFDIEDYDLIKNYCWYENDQGYAVTHINDKNIRMHRMIMNPDSSELIDHKDSNRLNNRKNNLRIATKQTNGINRPCNANNKLGIKGVNLQSNGDKYTARIMKDGITLHLGSYNTVEEAALARKEKEEELFGEFAYKQ